MKQHQSSSSNPPDALSNGFFGFALFAVAVAAAIVGHDGTYDLSVSMRSGHHVVQVEMKSSNGMALASESASGRLHGG